MSTNLARFGGGVSDIACVEWTDFTASRNEIKNDELG